MQVKKIKPCGHYTTWPYLRLPAVKLGSVGATKTKKRAICSIGHISSETSPTPSAIALFPDRTSLILKNTRYPDVIIRTTAYGSHSNQDLKAATKTLGETLLAFEKSRRESLDTISKAANSSPADRRVRLEEFDAKNTVEFQKTLLPDVRDVQVELVKRTEDKELGSSRVPVNIDALHTLNTGIFTGAAPLDGIASYLRTLSDKL